MTMRPKTPALGSPYRNRPTTLESLQQELSEHKADTALGFAQMSGKLDTVDGKLDVVLDLFAEAQRGKTQVVVEEQKTERVRLTARSRLAVAALGIVSAAIGAAAAIMAGCA